MIPVAGRPYASLVEAAAKTHGLPAALVYAICAQESGFRATAYRAEVAIKDGSHGLMQLLYRTAKALGYTGEVGEASKGTGLYDPATNLDLGCRLLAQNLKLAGNLKGAISAYNGGYRPHLGFGKPADRPLSICLARDQVTGDCIRRREVPAGDYSNAGYVLAVMARIEAYTGQSGPQAA